MSEAIQAESVQNASESLTISRPVPWGTIFLPFYSAPNTGLSLLVPERAPSNPSDQYGYFTLGDAAHARLQGYKGYVSKVVKPLGEVCCAGRWSWAVYYSYGTTSYPSYVTTIGTQSLPMETLNDVVKDLFPLELQAATLKAMLKIAEG